jgi:hypothetical protein
MPSVFDKLNLKLQREILIINAPSSFESELAALKDVVVLRDAKKAKTVHFAIAFATRQAEVDALSQTLASKAEGDALLWFAYPKGTSKRYQCEFNRDTGWDVLRSTGFDSVRMVAIDEDWSALRFRRVEFIKVVGKQPRVYDLLSARVGNKLPPTTIVATCTENMFKH